MKEIKQHIDRYMEEQIATCLAPQIFKLSVLLLWAISLQRIKEMDTKKAAGTAFLIICPIFINSNFAHKF